MAKISSANERIISIKSFLGLNENPDGDTNLKTGEAAVMSNFKITDDGSLQIRGGTRNMAGLLPNGEYVIATSATPTVLQTELNISTYSFTAQPNKTLSAGGLIVITGTAATVNYDNFGSYQNYYYKNQSGLTYQFKDCVYTPASGDVSLEGGAVVLGDEVLLYTQSGIEFSTYNPKVISGKLKHMNMVTSSSYNTQLAIGKFTPDLKYVITSMSETGKWGLYDEIANWYARPVTNIVDDKYEWRFCAVTATTSMDDLSVKGVWSGYVGEGAKKKEYLVAACGGKLWSLTESGGVWIKTAAGNMLTSEKVHFFGMNEKLYILTGSEYKVWDGETLKDVEGYVPVVAISTPPEGGGTLLEQVNKLTGSKRQRFSPNGSSDTGRIFRLAENGISRVDWVKLNGEKLTENSSYEVGLEGGYISFYTAPEAGTNTLEVQWTKGSGNRGAVIAMRYSEFFNGSNDTRVFLYGDGTNNVIYSGIGENGQPRADYFPNLNEAKIGDANTPVTGLVKHYSTLIAFKENSAYSITYGMLTFDDETTNAGFYVLPLNKTIGNTAMGQAMLVENNPRTLDGRSVYEWQGVNSMLTNDQRNARRISERIETTLKEIDFSKAGAYFDKINHEYYIMQGGVALVHNTENDTWYVYRDLPATCMIVYKDEVYIGTSDGYIRHFSRDYLNDNGTPITAYFESGSMDFGVGYKKKSSRGIWVSLKPEEYSGVNVTVQTDAQNDFDDAKLLSDYTIPASNGVFTSFLELDFSRFSFGTNNKPQTKRLKIRARDFTFYKLIFTSRPDFRATILGADIQASYLGNVR